MRSENECVKGVARWCRTGTCTTCSVLDYSVTSPASVVCTFRKINTVKKMRVNEIENIKHILTTLGCKWCPYFTLLRSIVGTWVLREIKN